MATRWKSKLDPIEYVKLKIQKHVFDSLDVVIQQRVVALFKVVA